MWSDDASSSFHARLLSDGMMHKYLLEIEPQRTSKIWLMHYWLHYALLSFARCIHHDWRVRGGGVVQHQRNATISLIIQANWPFLVSNKSAFLSFLPKFPPASSCFFTRSGMNFFAQKMNFTVFYLVRKWIYPKKQWNFQKTGKFIFWKMNFTVFSGKFIFWLNKNG